MVKANETNLEGILEGKRQYQVPLYQRVYSWGPKQIDQLWEDLIEIAEARRAWGTPTHFIRSLVLAASPDNGVVGVHKFLVVDGQQRLTTLSILLAAIRDHLSESDGQEHRTRIDAQYLVNTYEAGKPPKLVPTQADRSAYLAIVRASAEAGGEDAVGAAYRRFRVKLAEIPTIPRIPTTSRRSRTPCSVGWRWSRSRRRPATTRTGSSSHSTTPVCGSPSRICSRTTYSCVWRSCRGGVRSAVASVGGQARRGEPGAAVLAGPRAERREGQAVGHLSGPAAPLRRPDHPGAGRSRDPPDRRARRRPGDHPQTRTRAEPSPSEAA